MDVSGQVASHLTSGVCSLVRREPGNGHIPDLLMHHFRGFLSERLVIAGLVSVETTYTDSSSRAIVSHEK